MRKHMKAGMQGFLWKLRLYIWRAHDGCVRENGSAPNQGWPVEATQTKELIFRRKTNETESGLDSLIKVQGRPVFLGGAVKVFDLLFGCWHKRVSFPMTRKAAQQRSGESRRAGTYIVCLDCGKEFGYDWKEMRVLSAREQRASAHAHLEAKAS
jgi:hypothetical protein